MTNGKGDNRGSGKGYHKSQEDDWIKFVNRNGSVATEYRGPSSIMTWGGLNQKRAEKKEMKRLAGIAAKKAIFAMNQFYYELKEEFRASQEERSHYQRENYGKAAD